MTYIGKHRKTLSITNTGEPGAITLIDPRPVADWQTELNDAAFIDNRLDPYTVRLGTGFDRDRDGATPASPLSHK